MRVVPEFAVLIAILLGIAGGVAAFYFWHDLWVCVVATLGSLFSSAYLLRLVSA